MKTLQHHTTVLREKDQHQQASTGKGWKYLDETGRTARKVEGALQQLTQRQACRQSTHHRI